MEWTNELSQAAPFAKASTVAPTEPVHTDAPVQRFSSLQDALMRGHRSLIDPSDNQRRRIGVDQTPAENTSLHGGIGDGIGSTKGSEDAAGGSADEEARQKECGRSSAAKKCGDAATFRDSFSRPHVRPHDTVTSGNVVWCVLCGAYAEAKAAKLIGQCNGKPNRGKGYGWAWGQHKKLTRGVHPRTGEALLPPKRHDGTAWEPGIGKYLKLQSSIGEVVDNKFYLYIPEDFRPGKVAKVSSGESVQDKMQARLDKVCKREAGNVGVVRMSL